MQIKKDLLAAFCLSSALIKCSACFESLVKMFLHLHVHRETSERFLLMEKLWAVAARLHLSATVWFTYYSHLIISFEYLKETTIPQFQRKEESRFNFISRFEPFTLLVSNTCLLQNNLHIVSQKATERAPDPLPPASADLCRARVAFTARL